MSELSSPYAAQPSHAALAEILRRLGAGACANEPMGNHASLRIGGPADVFLAARTTSRLIEAVELASSLGVPWRVIGSGSNVLISDDGIDGLVVKSAMTSRSWKLLPSGSEATAEAEAGCILASLARQTAQDGLEGLEWAINVPGTVGGAVVNNSGAFGSSIAEHLARATVLLPGQGLTTMTPEQLGLAYRTSVLKRGELQGVVLSGAFGLKPGARAEIQARMHDTQRARQAAQPTGPSLGSMFANPQGDAAGRLIEAAGLKGSRCGGAEVSALHANFMLNRGGARAQDVLALMRQAQHAVWQEAGHWLVPEVQLVGRWRYEDRLALQSAPGQSSQSAPRGQASETFRAARASNQ